MHIKPIHRASCHCGGGSAMGIVALAGGTATGVMAISGGSSRSAIPI